MLGIILTVVAVFLAICSAFYFADHPLGRKREADAWLYGLGKSLKKNSHREHR